MSYRVSKEKCLLRRDSAKSAFRDSIHENRSATRTTNDVSSPPTQANSLNQRQIAQSAGPSLRWGFQETNLLDNCLISGARYHVSLDFKIAGSTGSLRQFVFCAVRPDAGFAREPKVPDGG